MKRWRPPTRRLILIALLLLAGAVVNVGVAWVLVGAPESWTPGGPRDYSAVAFDMRDEIRARLEAPASPTVSVSAQIGFGWTWSLVRQWDDAAPSTPEWGGVSVAGGWPCRSMDFIKRSEGQGQWSYSPSLEAPRRLVPRGWFNDYCRDRLPLTPIPAGFAINTLFYAAILALPLSVFPIRRRLRARRGRCPKCGYDLAGLAGADPAAPCPECGATR